MANEAKYPIPSFHFRVEWGGTYIGFSEVTGLSVETQVIEYRDGSNNDLSSLKMPGQQKFGNVTLKRGVMPNDNEFFEWWNKHLLNTIERRPITISLLNEKHEPVIAWTLQNAWPTKVSNTDLKATGNEVSIESIELAHEGITIKKG
jgi:phage tail-like protein